MSLNRMAYWPQLLLVKRLVIRNIMPPWLVKQLAQIIVRYAVALLVGIVFVSLAHFSIISALSNSFFSQTMILPLSSLMIPSVLVWHLIAQFSPIMRRYKRYVEIKSASITVVFVLGGVVVWLPELTPEATVDITLFVSTFTIAFGLCGYAMDWLKTKEWALCRFIIT